MKLVQKPDIEDVIQMRMEGKPGGAFLDAFERLVTPGSHVVLDMKDATAFKGNDLEDLVMAHNHCDRHGGGLVLAGLPTDLTYLLGLLELDQFFSIAPTIADATRLLKTQSASPITTMRMVAMRRDEIVNQEPAQLDPEEAARKQIHGIKSSLRYLAPNEARIQLLAYLIEQGTDSIDEIRTAQALKQERTFVERAFHRLRALRILVVNGETLRFLPRPQVHSLIQDILTMWHDRANRPKMKEWMQPPASE